MNSCETINTVFRLFLFTAYLTVAKTRPISVFNFNREPYRPEIFYGFVFNDKTKHGRLLDAVRLAVKNRNGKRCFFATVR